MFSRSRSHSPKNKSVSQDIDTLVSDLFADVTIQDKPDEQPFNDLLSNLTPHVQTTLSHPLGKALLTIACHLKKNNEKQGIPCIDINAICKHFADQKEMETNNMENILSLSKQDFLQDLENRHAKYSRHDPNLPIQPPSNFAPHNVLTTSDKEKLALQRFPTAPSLRFTGTKNYENILETLSLINLAQEQTNLSKEEFRTFFLKCFSGEAFNYLRRCNLEGYEISDLYSLLLSLYCPSITPQQAESILANYKAPRHLNLALIIADLEELVTTAVSIYKIKNSETSNDSQALNKTIYNIKLINALTNCLPEFSKNKTLLAYEHLQARNPGCIPTISQLRNELLNFKLSINNDISRHGISRQEYDLIMKHKNHPHNSHTSYSSSANAANARANFSFHIPQTKKPYINSQFRQNRPVSRVAINALNSRPQMNSYSTNSTNQRGRNMNRPYVRTNVSPDINKKSTLKCTFCGKVGHTSSQICYKIRDDNGKLVRTMPSSLPCSICEKKSQILFHPENLCFNRPIYLKLQRENRIPFVTSKDIEQLKLLK